MNIHTNQPQEPGTFVPTAPHYNPQTGQLILPDQPPLPVGPVPSFTGAGQSPVYPAHPVQRVVPLLQTPRKPYPLRRMLVFTALSIVLAILSSLSIGRQIFPASAITQGGQTTNTGQGNTRQAPPMSHSSPTARPSVSTNLTPTAVSPVVKPTTGTTPIATAPVTPTTPAGASPMILLAQDTFSRMDQRFWGVTSSGQAWQGDAANNALFSIQRQEGVVANGSGFYNGLLGPQSTNVSVVFSGLITSFNNASLGAVTRWQDNNNWYKAYIDGTQLLIVKRVQGQSSTLATLPFPTQANIPYTMRFNVVGSTLQVRVWPTGTTEPTGWLLTATDTSLTKGFCGLRIGMQQGVEAFFLSFSDYVMSAGQ